MATTLPPVPPVPPAPLAPPPEKARDAYVVGPRARAGAIVARICAVGLMLGLLGGLTALADTTSGTSLFDMARNKGPRITETQLPPFGFFIGPALILILLPIARGTAPRAFAKRGYLPRVVIASVLWVAGLVALIVEVSSLDSRFTIAAGTYVGGALILVGLIATLAMWPSGFTTVRLSKSGAGATPAPAIPPPPPAAQATAPLACPAGSVWGAPAQPRPSSHTGRNVALGTLAGLIVVVAVLFFAVVQPDIAQKNDARAALRDAKSLVDRSYPLSRAATRDTMRAANSTALARRVVGRLDRVIALRRRAIQKLAPVKPLPLGDDRFDKAAAAWTSELRASNRSARDLQLALRRARQGSPTPLLGISMSAIRDLRDAMTAADAQLKATERGTIKPRL